MAEPLRGLSSMATKALLDELTKMLLRDRSMVVSFESAGGIEVARDIRAGAQADLAVLGSDQMSELQADGLFVPGTLTPLFVSDVVAAVTEDSLLEALCTEDDLRAALVAADRIAYSTGPSGKAIVDLIRRWELLPVVQDKLVQARPGVGVGSLLASADADLGFQQRSELAAVDGIRLLGPLPGSAAIRSIFSGAVLAGSTDPGAALEVLRFMESGDVAEWVAAAGMSLVALP